MNFSFLADVQSAFESFFVTLASSISYNALFFVGLGLEVFFILLFGILTHFSYESRMRRSLDKLNRWLFTHKTLDKENIKEFNDMVKTAPKRLAVNWQQYILYREKAPSQYMSAENIIEKPLRTSSFSANIKNLTWVSAVWAVIMFIVAIAYQNFGDTILNATMLIIALLIPVLILIISTITVMILRARKNFNLDELYQNLHLFDRFIDNACVDLPAYIDYSLLFTAKEIDKGIPALREYLESRARKEKEEFDKIAKEEGVTYEKYDFEGIGIDGQNILERAMKESEAYLSKRDKTLAKIAQIEATVESLKRNFDNIQKDFQKRMQVSKENIERLRQQQEETTNRIESNFLRKQQSQEIAKQEKEQADFEQQKNRYLIEKSDYEEVIKTLNDEIEANKTEVEEAMMSEYESFYSKLFQSAIDEAQNKVKDKINTLTQTNQAIEEDLTVKEAQLKRVIDENQTLKRKLGVEYEQIEIQSAELAPKQEEEQDAEQSASALVTPSEIKKAIKDKNKEAKESKQELEKSKESFADNQKISTILSDEQPQPDEQQAAVADQPQPEPYVPELPQQEEPQMVEEPAPAPEAQPSDAGQEGAPVSSSLAMQLNDDDFDFDVPAVEEAPKPKPKTKPAKPVSSTTASTAKRRGRPKKGEEKTLEEMIKEKRSRGRPKKATTQAAAENKAPKKRGRPVGSTKKPKVEQPVVKRGRGRPKKDVSELKAINKKIDNEQKRLATLKAQIDSEIKNAINDLESGSTKQDRRDEILKEINALKANVAEIKTQKAASEQIENINKRIEALMQEIKSLNE